MAGEPGESPKPPMQASSPDRAPAPGWGSIDVSSPQEDFAVSTDEQEALRKFELRKTIARPFIDKVIPDKPLDFFYAATAARYRKTVDQLDDEDKGEARNAWNSSNFNKQQLVKDISLKEVPDHNLEGYISAVYGIASTLIPPNKEISPHTLIGFVNSSDSAEQARLHQELAQKWKDRFMQTSDGKTLDWRIATFSNLITDLTGCNRYPKPEPRSPELTRQLFDALSDVHAFIYSYPPNEQNSQLLRSFSSAVETLGLEFNDPNQIRRSLKMFQEVASYPDQEVLEKFTDTTSRYTRHHGLTDDGVEGLTSKLLPAIQNQDAQIDILLKGGNIWAMHAREFGVGDFLTHAYAVKVTPDNLNELMIASRTVPATSLARLEQNRLDALTMSAPFGILRDFIHDQRPHVNEVVSAMVHYYDTGDRSQLEQVLPKAEYFNSEDRIQTMFNREKYDMEVQEVAKEWGSDDKTERRKVKSIEILRRLAENTKPVPDLPPDTTDNELNKKLKTLAESKTGRAVPKEALKNVLDYVNDQLVRLMAKGEIGIEPNHILVLSWLERRGFEVLQNMKYEEQQGAYKQEWFASLLRFQELTTSASQVDETAFQSFLGELKNSSSVDAYKILAAHVLRNVNILARNYQTKGMTDTGVLWSGNITHELIGLTDFKTPETEQGRKAIVEAQKRQIEPGYHPGD